MAVKRNKKQKVSRERAREIAMNLNGISFGLVQRYTDSELRECLRLLKLQADF